MTYLLDTNILSELIKDTPNEDVLQFVSKLNDSYISMITVFELQFGVASLPTGTKRQKRFRNYLDFILSEYESNTISIGVVESVRAADLKAGMKKKGLTIHTEDAIIAASAMIHDLTLVTRNTKDIKIKNLKLYNPWID